jgi:outer membrane protein assembly factor BamB
MKYTFAIAIALVIGLFSPVAYAQSFSWPQWQGPTRDGLTKERGLLQAWPEKGPRQRWLFENCGAGYAGPAIADGRLFIMGERNGSAELIALNADTGDELWAVAIGSEYQNDWGDGPRNTPAVDGDRVYALSATGVLVCVKAEDGEELWRVPMESLGGKVPNWGYAESVLIDGDKVLCTPGGPQGAVAALDKMTGRVIWQSRGVPDYAHYSSTVVGEFNGQRQYVHLLEKRLVGLSAEDGSLLWEVEWPGSVAVVPTPIIRGNQIFITSGYGAGCMLVEIGPNNEATKVYENKRMKNQHGGVIELGGYVYGFSDDVGWACIDWKTGDLEWRDREALGKGAIGYADGRFYCVDEREGHVVLIEASPKGWAERGRLVLEPQAKDRAPRGGIWVHPVIVNGKLYLRDQEYVYCYDVKK